MEKLITPSQTANFNAEFAVALILVMLVSGFVGFVVIRFIMNFNLRMAEIAAKKIVLVDQTIAEIYGADSEVSKSVSKVCIDFINTKASTLYAPSAAKILKNALGSKIYKEYIKRIVPYVVELKGPNKDIVVSYNDEQLAYITNVKEYAKMQSEEV